MARERFSRSSYLHADHTVKWLAAVRVIGTELSTGPNWDVCVEAEELFACCCWKTWFWRYWIFDDKLVGIYEGDTEPELLFVVAPLYKKENAYKPQRSNKILTR